MTASDCEKQREYLGQKNSDIKLIIAFYAAKRQFIMLFCIFYIKIHQNAFSVLYKK